MYATLPTPRACATSCSAACPACQCCCCTATSAAASCWWRSTAGATPEGRDSGFGKARVCASLLTNPVSRTLFPIFHRPLPALERLLPTARDRQLSFRRIVRDHRAGADGGLRADRHRRHQGGVRADEGAVIDAGDELVHAVVVAGDGAGADVDAAADLGIAQVAEMVGLAAFADAGFLDLDEVAHVHAGGEFGAGAQTRERANRARAVGDDPVQVAVRMQHGTGGQSHV